MASVDICDVSKPLMTIEDIKLVQAVFAIEAIEFLTRNAHVWIEYPKDFVTRFTYLKGTQFTDGMGKAIVIIAYFNRMEYRARYRQPVNLETDLCLYEDCVRSYSFPKKNCFYHYLAWNAFIFDLTMYCYKKGYDYIERCKEFITEYPDISDLHSNVGYYNLINNSLYIERKYRKAVHGKIKDEDIVSFTKRLENIERRDRYSNNRWLFTPNMTNASHIKSNLSEKYSYVSEHDPRKVTPGYRVILKKSTSKSTLEVFPKSSKVQVSETQKCNSGGKDDLAIDLNSLKDKTMSEDTASKTEPSFSWNTDDSNSVFIMHKRFLNRRKASREDSKYKRSLKICSPSMNSDVLAPNLNDVLNENIDKGNCTDIGHCLHAVISKAATGCIVDENDTQIIVLDTSEEEEDYSCPKQFHEIADVIWPGYLNPNCTIDVTEELFGIEPSKHIESESKESVSGMTTEQKCKQSKISEAKSIESTNQILDKEISTKTPEQRMIELSKITEALLKENGTVVYPEQKPFITKSTGAISKVRKADLKKRPHTSNLSEDSEDSD